MNINKRLFGTPIRGKVREKLEERQRLAAAPQPGESLESIDGVFKDNGKVVNELGSRTPFVRMWTSVKIIEAGEVVEDIDPAPIDSLRSSGAGNIQILFQFFNIRLGIKTNLNRWKTQF